jgi:uncharacterized protein YbbC (DUF1343 family)
MYNSDPSMAGEENACFGPSEGLPTQTPKIRARRIPVFMKPLSAALFALQIWVSVILPSAESASGVLNGIDVLSEQNFSVLAGKRVGLVTNHTGLAADGTATIDLLFRSNTCRLVALFSPEHGIRGTLDAKFDSTVDEATGLPIYSLYGDVKRPSAEMLKQIDVLVFDIQDIGARFYTYITTMGYCMEEAAKAGIPFIVLDRPNPIGGEHVEGPMLDADKTSFIGYMPLPVRYGMTIGELARFFNSENKIGAQLHVVEMRGWRRSYYFWDTGQLWVNPSPNMRNLTAAFLYPGVCLLEGTNLSVGRGTDRPFEMIGAPWIEPGRFVAALQSARVPGVRFVPVYFTPNTDKNQGVRCGGASLLITDTEKLNSVLLGLTLISTLNKLYPNEFKMDRIGEYLGNESAMRMLKEDKSPSEVLRRDDPVLKRFLTKRQRALIYDSKPSRKGGRQ